MPPSSDQPGADPGATGQSSGGVLKERWRKRFASMGMRLAYMSKRLGQPLTITTPKQLREFINSQARELIRQAVDPRYNPHQPPPAAVNAIITALLWQHSLHCWRESVEFNDHLRLRHQTEKHWLQACVGLLDTQLGKQQSDRLTLHLRSGFHGSARPGPAHLSRELHQSLAPWLERHVSRGLLRLWCDAYQQDWQTHISSRNVIRIMLL